MRTMQALFSSRSAPVISDAERQLRIDLAACYRLVDLFGMSDMILNHISARVPGDDVHFLINPFGMMYEEITASSLIKIDLDGNIIHNPNTDYTINLAGYVIHSAIHGARHDVGCVLHTHTPAGMAVSALECGLLPLNQTAMRFAGGVGYHEFEGVAVDTDERRRLVSSLGDKDALILRNHGLLTVGQDVAEAFVNMQRLERACQTQLLTMSANSPIHMPPQAAVDKAYNQLRRAPTPDIHGNFPPHGRREWPALLRMLDRRDASYRD
ncbi:class II aldolase/adducin family protein [Pigmentiphaga litoralis]|uniref:class II aldolase/adducin family protein n=1 Tax=Pigmentiphaga litoralis TaxID=516702 RepID=UPI0015C80EC3